MSQLRQAAEHLQRLRLLQQVPGQVQRDQGSARQLLPWALHGLKFVLRQGELLQSGQLAKAVDVLDLIAGQVQLGEQRQVGQPGDRLDLVARQVQRLDRLVAREFLASLDVVAAEAHHFQGLEGQWSQLCQRVAIHNEVRQDREDRVAFFNGVPAFDGGHTIIRQVELQDMFEALQQGQVLDRILTQVQMLQMSVVVDAPDDTDSPVHA
mmetsp:Transcript_40590/g.130579  ORF Transcript_40590/g.130579 Transcript_40590/m.130579 type:complete len:209 (-) Transcript_40590:2244-2870(-)